MKCRCEMKRLGDVCEVVGGGTPSKANSKFYNGNIPWATVRDMKCELIATTEHKITEEAVKKSSTNIIPKGNVVVATRVGLGKVCLLKHDTAINQDLRGIIPKKASVLSTLYLFRWLKSVAHIIEAEGTGATVKGVKLPFLKSLSIPVPPLSEQNWIVSVLDEVFDKAAKAKENAEKNLQNARELFESYMQSVFASPGDGWITRTLDQVCVVERGSSPRPIKKYFTTESSGVNWIKIGDTEEGGKYVYFTAQKITPEGAKQSRYVKEGDFILTNSMSFGRPYIMKTDGYIHDGWFVLRLSDSIDTEYFYYLLSSKYLQMQFSLLAAGAIVKNISGDLVKRAILPIPPLSQQKILVKHFIALSTETKKLEGIYQKKLADLEELKKSVLHKVFNGEL